MSDTSADILVAGCGRSGTTWLAEIINYDNAFRFIFEPFRRDIGVEVADALGYWPYVRPDCRTPALIDGLRTLFEGRFASEWTDRFNCAGNTSRLVKAVRAHFLLGWIRDVLPNLRLVLIVRHPCAVAASEMRMGWTGWQEPVDAMFAQPALLADHLGPYRDAILSARSTFEQRIVLWCVRTLVPLRQLADRDVHIVFYEQLVTDADARLPELFGYLGRPYNAEAVRAVWARPSRMEVAVPEVAPNARPVDAWREEFGDAHERRAAEILDQFDLVNLYSAAGWPNPL